MTQTNPSFSLPGSKPQEYQLQMNEAGAYLRSGQPGKALAVLEAMRAKWPEDVHLISTLGQVNIKLGRGAVGKQFLEKSLAMRPDDIEDLRSLASAWRAGGKFDEANACLDRILQLRPDDLNALAHKAELLVLQADEAAAAAMIEPALKRDTVDMTIGWVFSRAAPKVGRVEEALQYLKRVEVNPPKDAQSRASLFFCIGDMLDRLGRYEEAFPYFHRANEQVQYRYESEAVEAAFDRVIQVWTRETIRRLPTSDIDDESLMFIVGMPRSGTTLVEQVLSCLPGAYAAGELGGIPAAGMSIMGKAIVGLPLIVFPDLVTKEKVVSNATKYLEFLRELAPEATRIIDKMPQNFAMLGLIQLMFPRARIIHCMRNPMDTCLSCYMHMFFGYMPYAYRLSTLGHFYRQYVKIMDHWKKVLDIPIIDMPYESVVDDFESKARELVAFTGLPWTDDCLRFHESKRLAMTTSNAQVRKPIYKTSSGRWRNYEKFLGPLRDALGPLAPK